MKKIIDLIKAKSSSNVFVIILALIGGLISSCAISTPLLLIFNANKAEGAQSSLILGFTWLIAFIAISTTIVVTLRKVGNPEYFIKNEQGETLVYNIYLGHFISSARYGNTSETAYLYSPISVYRKNIGKTETEVICNTCGEKIKVVVKSNVQCQIQRIGKVLLLTLLFIWLPIINVIIPIIGIIIYIFPPLSGIEGIKLYQTGNSKYQHDPVEKK